MKFSQLTVHDCLVRLRERLTKLAHAAERRDFTPENLLKDKIEIVERSIALTGIERGGGGLRENERFTHRLFAGREIGEQGIASAGAFDLVMGGGMRAAGVIMRQWVGKYGKDFVERPVEQMDECVGMAKRRGDGFGTQQSFPVGPDFGPPGAQ